MRKKILAVIVALFAALTLAFSVAPGSANSSQLAAPTSISFSLKSSCTTNASGYCTVNHNLGVIPDAVQAQAINYSALTTTRNWTATTAELRFSKRINSSNGVDPWPNVTVNFSLIGMYTPAVVTTPPTTDPTTPPTTEPTTPPTTPPTTEPTPEPTLGQFPNAANTGVPTGTVLTAQSCPSDTLVITTNGTVIDSKTIACDVEVRATNVVISKSRVTGSVYTPDGATNYSFRLEDSEVTYPTVTNAGRTMVGEAGFTVLRSEINGGNRGIYCRKACTVQDSWVHGIKVTGTLHASAIRVSQGATLTHNTIHCDAPDNGEAGCSANMTGYPDFESVKNNTVTGNLFKATPGGFCAYGGATSGKPFSNAADNATNVVFKDNVFERGSGNKCGFWGAITDFNGSRPGNVWTNNKWDDGAVLNP